MRGLRPLILATLCVASVSACGAVTSTVPVETSRGSTGIPGPTARSGTPQATPDLSARPLLWFAPLPPLPTSPGRAYIGSDDFMALFAPGAPWAHAAARIGVFKLYGEWVAYDATPEQLREAVAGIRDRGMALAVEMGPLTATAACGTGVESFAGIDEGRLISDRIRAAGGTLDIVALDEPYFYGHVYDGPGACHWTPEQVAAGIAEYVIAMRAQWPQLIVGDTEPTPAPVSAADLAAWLDVYERVVGEPPAFIHLDVDWSRSGWPSLAANVLAKGRALGIPVGMIYDGGEATSDATWAAAAGRRALAFEAAAGPPDHVLFQSWMDKPDHVLPETDPTTFTALVNRYLDDRSTLGQVPGGPTDLALSRHSTASSSLAGSPAAAAVDGDADTIWSSGTRPPGWIQIDLGATRQIAEIRLDISQYPDGVTHHRVTCRATVGGSPVRLADLSGPTSDLQVLTVRLDRPMACRILRVETLVSPSWVAWREIEVLGPG